jgi:outer membrane protein OmpA-like peptidoglycan-associated protein
VRKFESAVICVETAETFGSISWGDTKTGTGVITLQGGTAKDVLTTSASTGFETTRQAFYSGFFQLSLSDFATGSAAQSTTHETLLDGIDTKDLTRVILVGANDNSGGPGAKAALSLKRAEAARDYLVKSRAVPRSVVRTEGDGVEARVPNPPGKDVAANRRVDVHLQRGAETRKPAHARPGSRAERKRLRDQNPRRTADEAVGTIVRLDSTTGRVPMGEWAGLLDMLDALDQWRSVDPTVPDLRKIYSAALRRLKDRAMVAALPQRAPIPLTGPISPEVDEALRQYEEAMRRVEELKRERRQKLREFDERAPGQPAERVARRGLPRAVCRAAGLRRCGRLGHAVAAGPQRDGQHLRARLAGASIVARLRRSWRTRSGSEATHLPKETLIKS